VIRDVVAGVGGTLSIAALAWLLGTPIALFLAFEAVLSSEVRRLVRFAAIALSVLPFLAILFWIHYPLQAILGVVWSPFVSTVGLLTVFIALLVADIVAEEMIRMQAGLDEAARVLGISESVFLRRVVFPAALQVALSRLLALGITSIHITMFASLIGVEETFRIIQRLNAEYLRPVELFTLMAALYAVMCVPLYIIAAKARQKLEI
jgi:polar amino acid transport system permease protein